MSQQKYEPKYSQPGGSKFCDDDRHTQEAYKRNKGKIINDNPYKDIQEFPDEASLFIGDLSRTVNEEQLMKLFSECGPVECVDIKRDKVTKNNLGYGFVKFADRDMAERAKNKMQGYEIGGRAMRIGWAQKNTNLFVCLVGDVEERITGKDLQTIFKEFGPIYEEDTFVKRNKYGFVKFKHRAHAEKAKAALDGKHLILTDYKTAKPVRIGWGDANTQRNCVHVQFEQNSASNVGLGEEDFKQQFQKFGIVNKVSLPRYSDKRLKGYGFIHFEENDEGEESAARAITELTASQIRGVVIMCNFGKRQNQRHKRFAQKKQNDMNGYGGYDDQRNGGYMNDNNMNMNMNMGMNQNNNGYNGYNGNNNGYSNYNQMNDMGMNNNNNGMGNNFNMNGMNSMNPMNGNMNNQNYGMNNQNMGDMMNSMSNMGPPPMMNGMNGMNNNPMMNPMGPPMGMNNNMNMNNNMGQPPMMNNNMNNNNNNTMNPMMNVNTQQTNMSNNNASNQNSTANPMMPVPSLSGPNPFLPMPSNMNNPMIMPPPSMNPPPQITVGSLPPNMTGLPPSPPPPQHMQLPPDPSNFRLKNISNVSNISTPQKSLNSNGANDGDKGDKNNNNNDDKNGNNVQSNPSTNKLPNFSLPFNNLPPSFPVPQAPPQLNGTGPNTPNGSSANPMIPSFLPPLGGLNNPMFSNLPGGSTSNSPSLNPINPSPPNSLFIPQLPFGTLPSPNMTQLPGFNPMRPTTSPSPPVSPLLNNLPVPPFIPSPNLNLNNPMFNKTQPPPMPNMNLNNLTNQLNQLNMQNIHQPLIMQNNNNNFNNNNNNNNPMLNGNNNEQSKQQNANAQK